MSVEGQAQPVIERVLIVDNEDFVLQALERLFYGEPFETLTASSAEEAMRIIQDREISVLLSDNEMAGLSGIDLLTWARKSSPGTIRIMLTGYAEVQTVIRALNEAEVFRFFIKPCDFAKLKKVVHEALVVGRSRRRQEAIETSKDQDVFFQEYLRQHCEDFDRIWAEFQKEATSRSEFEVAEP